MNTKKEKNVMLDVTGHIARIIIHRPDKLNALDTETCKELYRAFSEAEQDETVKAVILRGEGKAFCAGGDIREMAQLQGCLSAEVQQHIGVFQRLADKIYHFSKPVICAVQGAAAGAGFSLALAGDILIAADDAKFIQSFGKVGLVPDCGSSFLLTRAVGAQRAKDLIFSQRTITAQTACELGIVLKVVPREKLEETALAFAEEYAKQAVLSAMLCKELVNAAAEKGIHEMLQLEAACQEKCFFSKSFQEGYTAFLEKREPKFDR